jgi:hypothetical protein
VGRKESVPRRRRLHARLDGKLLLLHVRLLQRLCIAAMRTHRVRLLVPGACWRATMAVLQYCRLLLLLHGLPRLGCHCCS